MLHLLFQGIDQTLGPALQSVASLTYFGGIALVTASALLPLYRRWLERLAMGYGLQQVWIMTCPHCGKTTRTAGRHCAYCDQSLGLPVSLRLWSGATRTRTGTRGQTARWGFHLAGNMGFLILSGWLVFNADLFQAERSLHRLFLGLGLVAWAAAGWFTSRALRLAPTGFLGRVRDGMLACTSVGFLAVALFLAAEAKPTSESILATFSVESGAVRVGERWLQIPNGEVGFEYLQLDHDVLGYHDIVSLAFLGRTRMPLSHALPTELLVAHLRAHPDVYASRGLTVRLRTDRHRVAPGLRYEVVAREGQVVIRRASRGRGARTDSSPG